MQVSEFAKYCVSCYSSNPKMNPNETKIPLGPRFPPCLRRCGRAARSGGTPAPAFSLARRVWVLGGARVGGWGEGEGVGEGVSKGVRAGVRAKVRVRVRMGARRGRGRVLVMLVRLTACLPRLRRLSQKPKHKAMSYSYLFKYAALPTRTAQLKPRLRRGSPLMLGRLRASVQVHHHRRHRRREVVLAPAIHGQALPTSARPHHRGRVWCAHDHDRQQADQAPDLGHGARQPRSPAAPQRRAGAARIERASPPCPHRRGRSRSARSHDRTTEGLRALCWCTTSHGPPSTARSLPPRTCPRARRAALQPRAPAHGMRRLTGLGSRGYYHGATITGLL